MRYFFLIYALLAVFIVSALGFRGDKFKKPPIRIFPDMDEQDKIRSQRPSVFFRDGLGSRKPVTGTIPHGEKPAPTAQDELNGYGNKNTYLHTGFFDGTSYGKGFPVELDLYESVENQRALLARGHEVYQFQCTICHGASGDGKGVVPSLEVGMPSAADLQATKLTEGAIYDAVVNGKGNMKPMGTTLTLYDRWAVIAYVKAIQATRKADLSDPAVKKAFEHGSNAK